MTVTQCTSRKYCLPSTRVMAIQNHDDIALKQGGNIRDRVGRDFFYGVDYSQPLNECIKARVLGGDMAEMEILPPDMCVHSADDQRDNHKKDQGKDVASARNFK